MWFILQLAVHANKLTLAKPMLEKWKLLCSSVEMMVNTQMLVWWRCLKYLRHMTIFSMEEKHLTALEPMVHCAGVSYWYDISVKLDLKSFVLTYYSRWLLLVIIGADNLVTIIHQNYTLRGIWIILHFNALLFYETRNRHITACCFNSCQCMRQNGVFWTWAPTDSQITRQHLLWLWNYIEIRWIRTGLGRTFILYVAVNKYDSQCWKAVSEEYTIPRPKINNLCLLHTTRGGRWSNTIWRNAPRWRHMT